MLENLGFDIISVNMLDHGYDEAHSAPEEGHR